MELGILIGLAIVGLILVIANWHGAERGRDCAKGLSLGLILFLPSILGLVGRVIEGLV